jgi:putative transposase
MISGTKKRRETFFKRPRPAWNTGKVVINNNYSNALTLHHIDVGLWNNEHLLSLTEIVSIKYLNNVIKQNHRNINQYLRWKSDEGARTTPIGVDL